MKLRIRPKSRGTKGVDWERYYVLQIKAFLFYSTWKEFKTIEEAMGIIECFSVCEIEYKIFIV